MQGSCLLNSAGSGLAIHLSNCPAEDTEPSLAQAVPFCRRQLGYCCLSAAARGWFASNFSLCCRLHIQDFLRKAKTSLRRGAGEEEEGEGWRGRCYDTVGTSLSVFSSFFILYRTSRVKARGRELCWQIS